jgi:hypothetical protein
MVLRLLMPGGILHVPDHISDEELISNTSRPKNSK